MTTTPLPPIPANTPHITRRIRLCESEVPAQVVLEHAMQAYATQARADLEAENKRLREALIACLEKGKRWHPCDPVMVKANAALESKK